MRSVLLLAVSLIALLAPSTARADGGLEFIWPMEGRVQRVFDAPVHAYASGHRGVDVTGSPGAEVVAAAAGRVYFAGHVAGRGSVSIDHGNGWRTTYLPVTPHVRTGEAVEAGQVVGWLVDGHCPASACLHWGLTDGETYLDPTDYLTVPVIRLLPAGSVPDPLPVLPAARVSSGAPVSGPVTSAFGMRRHPVTGVLKLHDGVDYGAACGTPVVAPTAGTVVAASFDGAYGYRVTVDHGGGIVMAYAHLQGLDVTAGRRLSAGETLGRVGSTGLSTGCHLHWMAWQSGALVDPTTIL